MNNPLAPVAVGKDAEKWSNPLALKEVVERFHETEAMLGSFREHLFSLSDVTRQANEHGQSVQDVAQLLEIVLTKLEEYTGQLHQIQEGVVRSTKDSESLASQLASLSEVLPGLEADLTTQIANLDVRRQEELRTLEQIRAQTAAFAQTLGEKLSANTEMEKERDRALYLRMDEMDKRQELRSQELSQAQDRLSSQLRTLTSVGVLVAVLVLSALAVLVLRFG